MTDTLDAIAREKFAHTLSRMLLRRERSGAVTERGQRWVKAERDALQAAITALSNQGEGVVVAWLESEPGTEIAELRNADHPLHYYRSCIVHIGQREPAKKQPENSLFPLYDGPAEADRRDAERLDWLEKTHNSIDRNSGNDHWIVICHLSKFRSPSLREAIDAAIAATQEQT